MTSMKETSKIFVILGGIIGILEGLLILSGAWHGFWGGVLDFSIPIMALIAFVVVLVFSLIALATSGAVKIKSLKMTYNFIVLLIVGIVLVLFRAVLGGIFVIIGAILLILK